MEGRTIAEVVSSDLVDYKAGDLVFNPNHGWQIFASSDGKGVHSHSYELTYSSGAYQDTTTT